MVIVYVYLCMRPLLSLCTEKLEGKLKCCSISISLITLNHMSQVPRDKLGAIKSKTPPWCITMTYTSLSSNWVTCTHMQTYQCLKWWLKTRHSFLPSTLTHLVIIINTLLTIFIFPIISHYFVWNEWETSLQTWYLNT